MIFFASCYQNVEGCLDPNSSNYDVTADNACEDCCTYPTLSLTVGFFKGDSAYNRIDSIPNNNEIFFIIEDIQMYFSDISVSDGSENFRITETLNYVDNSGEEQEIIDDVVLVKPTAIRYPLGTFIEANDFNSFLLSLGVPEEIDDAQSIELSADHPLAIAGDSLYIVDQNQFVKSWIVLRQIGVHDVADTLQIDMPRFDYVFENLDINQERGSSLDLNVRFDYFKLINDIDYNTMDKSQVIEQIGNNLKLAVEPNY